MNIFKSMLQILKRAIHEEMYSDPIKSVELYRKKGVLVGDNTELYNVKLDGLRPFLINIGNNCLLTNCRILTHDASTKKTLGYTKIGKVSIGNNVFIGVNSIVLPNVKIGDNVIVGAGTIVAKDIPDDSIVIGNPMRIIGSFCDFEDKNRKKLEASYVFSLNYDLSEIEKKEMREKLENGIGFVKCEV